MENKNIEIMRRALEEAGPGRTTHQAALHRFVKVLGKFEPKDYENTFFSAMNRRDRVIVKDIRLEEETITYTIQQMGSKAENRCTLGDQPGLVTEVMRNILSAVEVAEVINEAKRKQQLTAEKNRAAIEEANKRH